MERLRSPVCLIIEPIAVGLIVALIPFPKCISAMYNLNAKTFDSRSWFKFSGMVIFTSWEHLSLSLSLSLSVSFSLYIYIYIEREIYFSSPYFPFSTKQMVFKILWLLAQFTPKAKTVPFLLANFHNIIRSFHLKQMDFFRHLVLIDSWKRGCYLRISNIFKWNSISFRKWSLILTPRLFSLYWLPCKPQINKCRVNIFHRVYLHRYLIFSTCLYIHRCSLYNTHAHMHSSLEMLAEVTDVKSVGTTKNPYIYR